MAFLRAVHQLIDEAPKILDDPVVVRLFDASALDRIRQAPDQFRTPRLNALRSHVVIRSRFAEDRLAEAVRRGIQQFICLGAGFDTFAYRQPAWAQAIRIFEVDHPASQKAKREPSEKAGIAVPSNVEFVPIDFEVTPLREGLKAATFDPARPAFISWLGVMVYLSEEAIDGVLRLVISMPRSSEIVFTFSQPAPADKSDPGQPSLAERAAVKGEPWRTRIAPDDLVRYLKIMGFSEVKLLTPAKIDEDYIGARRDGLRARSGSQHGQRHGLTGPGLKLLRIGRIRRILILPMRFMRSEILLAHR